VGNQLDSEPLAIWDVMHLGLAAQLRRPRTLEEAEKGRYPCPRVTPQIKDAERELDL
jgi:hypothetical protein